MGETINETAEREILEETNIKIRAEEQIRTFDFIERKETGDLRTHFVIVEVRSRYVSGTPKADDDALEARWVEPADLKSLDVTPSTLETLKNIGFIQQQKIHLVDQESRRLENLDLDLYLRETFYCDWGHHDVRELAERITADCKDEREKAVALFYWVRDNILYRMGYWDRKASETIREKEGTCTSKANLLIALLRALSIPAGYGMMDVLGQHYLGPIVPPMWRKCISERSRHVYACVFINGKWIKCDPSDDKEFSEKVCHISPQYNLLEWDGERDAMIKMNENFIIRDEYPFSTLDYILGKRRKIFKFVLDGGNIYLKYLRIYGDSYGDMYLLQNGFKSWLFKNDFKFYTICMSFSKFMTVRANFLSLLKKI